VKWRFLNFKLFSGFDWSLFLLPLLLAIFGIVIIFSITYGNASNITLNQIFFTAIGFFVVICLSFFDYRTLKGLYLILYLIGIILLIFVLFLGSRTFGATRWINLYVFQLQPSEVFKIIAVIFLAKVFADWQNDLGWQKILIILAAIAIPLFLILAQPDLGTASVVFIVTVVLLFSTPIKKYYLLIGIAVLLAFSPLAWHFLKPYQKHRIEAFINPATDPQGTGYNVSQSKIAVGSGGLLGTGLGKGSQSQLNFLPVAHTDFIFAGTAESTGFVGSLFLFILLVILMIRVINVARVAKDDFGMYLGIGFGTMFLFQMFVNIGMNLGIMPVTGIPLPFVSYGGSAMLSNMAAIGILQSIYARHRKINF
jgi:rod shape determining protein RodA